MIDRPEGGGDDIDMTTSEVKGVNVHSLLSFGRSSWWEQFGSLVLQMHNRDPENIPVLQQFGGGGEKRLSCALPIEEIWQCRFFVSFREIADCKKIWSTDMSCRCSRYLYTSLVDDLSVTHMPKVINWLKKSHAQCGFPFFPLTFLVGSSLRKLHCSFHLFQHLQPACSPW